MSVLKKIHLSQEEIEYIKNNCQSMSSTQLAMWIGCCPSSVRYHMRKLNLRGVNIKWTDDTIDMFRLYLKDYDCKQIASIMRTSTDNLYMAVMRFKKRGIINEMVWKTKNEKLNGISQRRNTRREKSDKQEVLLEVQR